MSIADKLQTIAENEQKIYENGKQAEYDRFWEDFQWGGTRTDYAAAFARWRRIKEIKPKYPVVAVGDAASIFYNFGRDIATGVKVDNVDFSQTTNLTAAFYGCLTIEEIGEIIPNDLEILGTCFAFCNKLHTIKKLKLSERTTYSTLGFRDCNELVNMEVLGTIGQPNLTLQYSTKLSKSSITSVVNALSTSKTGLTVTLSKTAVNKAFETSTGAANGSTSQEWLNLIATKSNWTISLA